MLIQLTTLYIVPTIVIILVLKFYPEVLGKYNVDVEKVKSATFIPLVSLVPASILLLVLLIHTFSGLSLKITNKILGE